MAAELGPVCPIPASQYPLVVLAHGGGGRLTQSLIQKMFVPAFDNPLLASLHDGARLDLASGKVAFTTDSYVVKPLFFPGGDIGSLAVYGTVNDLAMCGARPLYLSLALIIEEGLPMETLWTVTRSLQRAAAVAGVQVVTGDTKVVDKGKGDGLFVNTAGIGLREHDRLIEPASVRTGDAVLLSGDVGRHGVAVMAAREGLQFETTIESDCGPVATPVLRLLSAGIEVHCLRDLTRGGLATALVEIAQGAGVQINVEESTIPTRSEVRAVCEILGLDPLYLACEGRFIAFVPAEQAEEALTLMRVDSCCADSCAIGTVTASMPGLVALRTEIGASRVLDMLSGEQLPRIC